MKKLTFLLAAAAVLMLSTPASAQWGAGFGFSQFTHSGSDKVLDEAIPGFYFGIKYDFNFSTLEGLSFEPGVNIVHYGKTYSYLGFGEKEYRANYLSIPLNIKYTVEAGDDFTLSGFTGPRFNLGLGGNMFSRVGTLTVEFDPHAKFLKPAGYASGIVSTHPEYVERGRRPCKYRQGGSAIVPCLAEAPAKRLCAHRGLSAALPENSMPALGAAVALGASEIEFDLWPTRDGRAVSIHDLDLMRLAGVPGKVTDMAFDELRRIDFGALHGERMKGLRILTPEEILDKFACHVQMNVHVKGGEAWEEDVLARVVRSIREHEAERHCYFMTSCKAIQAQLARLAPEIPRCMGNGGCDNASRPDIVDNALECGCTMVQLFKPRFDQALIDRARAAGLRLNVFWSDDPAEARLFFDMGVDTILTNDWLPMSVALGVK